MAQTTHLALFGPVFVAAAPPVACFIDYHLPLCIYYKHQLASKKMKKKKTHLWPIFFATTPPIMYFIDYIYIYTKCQLFSKKIRKKNSLVTQMTCDLPSPVVVVDPIHSHSLSLITRQYRRKKKYNKKKHTCGSRHDAS